MLYANTDDGSSALWVLDGNGVVVDNISYSIADRAPILAQINEHYGTSFTGWSDNEIGLRIGDTMPNWNAYEKIERILIAIRTAAGQVTCEPGYIQNNIIHMFGKSAEEKILVVLVENGLVVAESGWSQTVENYLYQSVRAVYENVSDNIVIDDSPYNINDNIENWDSFEIIG